VRLSSLHRAAIVSAALSAGALAAPLARAHGGTVDAPAPPTPPAPPGDGATAEQILKKLETLDAKANAIIAEPVKQARKALERAHGARTGGDTSHARLLDALALEWAKTAETLSRAAKSEEGAATAQKQAQDATTQLDRSRTLLEETQARKGRAEAELARAQAEANQAAEDAKAAEEARLSGKKGKDAKDKDAKDKGAKDKDGKDKGAKDKDAKDKGAKGTIDKGPKGGAPLPAQPAAPKKGAK
jgi:hypothetical protein